MDTRTKRVFYKRTIRVGNSSGVLLPRNILGADVRITVVRLPRNTKRDIINLLSPILENILGVYLIWEREKSIEVLAVSINISRHIERDYYSIDVVPLERLKKSIKENKETKGKIMEATVIINTKLLSELKSIV